MSQENVLEESAEPSPAAYQGGELCCGGVGRGCSKVVAFKFGGSSLLGAERMLHAARLVRQAAELVAGAQRLVIYVGGGVVAGDLDRHGVTDLGQSHCLSRQRSAGA